MCAEAANHLFGVPHVISRLYNPDHERAYMQLAPWATLAPAGATVVTVMIFNCLGDFLRDYLDVEAAK